MLLPLSESELHLEPEDPRVRICRCGAGADVVLDARPKLQRWEDLDRVGEFDELLTGLDRLSRARQLKLKARIDVGPHPAEAQNIELAARKHSPRRRTRLVVMLEFGGVLITDGEDSEQRQPAALVAPPFVNLLRCLEVETLPSCVEYCGIGQA